jgi:hypothetical protein
MRSSWLLVFAGLASADPKGHPVFAKGGLKDHRNLLSLR